MLLAIEFVDELVYGTLGAAWPTVRADLALTYADIGAAVALSQLSGSVLDPVIGVLGDTGKRRAVMIAGGTAFAVAAALTSASLVFWMLVIALVVANPASGAFVGLAQATLMDVDPSRRERNMARWTLVGSFGYVGGPLLLMLALAVGAGWRLPLAALAVAALPLVAAVRRLPVASSSSDVTGAWHHAFAALRRRDVLRWLTLLEAADLLLDVFHGFLALYLVDVVHVAQTLAALSVAVWSGAGLVGDWLLLLVLRRMPGTRYLRLSAAAVLVAYPAFLLVPGAGAKLVVAVVLGVLNSGWYAIPKAGLYDTLHGRSGTAVAVGGVASAVGAGVPFALGVIAGAAGLASTMWLLLLAPMVLLALLPRS